MLAGPQPSPGAFPASASRIVYVTESEMGAVVGLMEPDGKRQRRLVIPVGIRGAASVSPNGTTLAMSSTVAFFRPARDSDLAIGGFIGGFEPWQAPGSNEGRPSWAPDGDRIVFASDRGGDWDLYAAGPEDSSGPWADLTSDSRAADRNPRWSPDGRLIAFESDRDGNWDVYVMPSAGGPAVNLTHDPGQDALGDWAPDSSKLVFTSTRTGDPELIVMSANGEDIHRLTYSSGADTHAAWSPDGRTIAFSSDRDGDDDVFTIAPDGSAERRLTTNASEDLVQDWQPLQDTRRPVVKALPGTGVRGRPVWLRYRVTEDSGIAAVSVQFRYRSGSGGISVLGAGTVGAIKSGRIQSLQLPASIPLPDRFRFCVQATDPSANESALSCATFRFAKKKA